MERNHHDQWDDDLSLYHASSSSVSVTVDNDSHSFYGKKDGDIAFPSNESATSCCHSSCSLSILEFKFSDDSEDDSNFEDPPYCNNKNKQNNVISQPAEEVYTDHQCQHKHKQWSISAKRLSKMAHCEIQTRMHDKKNRSQTLAMRFPKDFRKWHHSVWCCCPASQEPVSVHTREQRGNAIVAAWKRYRRQRRKLLSVNDEPLSDPHNTDTDFDDVVYTDDEHSCINVNSSSNSNSEKVQTKKINKRRREKDVAVIRGRKFDYSSKILDELTDIIVAYHRHSLPLNHFIVTSFIKILCFIRGEGHLLLKQDGGDYEGGGDRFGKSHVRRLARHLMIKDLASDRRPAGSDLVPFDHSLLCVILAKNKNPSVLEAINGMGGIKRFHNLGPLLAHRTTIRDTSGSFRKTSKSFVKNMFSSCDDAGEHHQDGEIRKHPIWGPYSY